ncbi:MAG: hypothetical protein H0V12_07020 [Chloroflexi bacterium]|nr:hypothetical protein [Chloroflexota bacterium]
MTDENWRLCGLQAFLWNNREFFGYDETVLESLAQDMLSNGTASAHWTSFAAKEREQFLDAWGGLHPITSVHQVVGGGGDQVMNS